MPDVVKRLTAVLGALTLAATLSLPVSAARVPEPTCWWEGTVLRGENLPPEWSTTSVPYPIGVTPRPSSIAIDWGTSFTVYFWTRGGPYAALFKPGPQLNDYKPFCIAEPGGT